MYFCQQVSRDGYVTFGRPCSECCPAPFTNTSMPNFIVAPYWTTCNRTTGGQVLYITQETGDNILERINDVLASEGFDFIAKWMLIVQWIAIPQPENAKVGENYKFNQHVYMCFYSNTT